MIIQCLSCGKAVSSNSSRCPYCMTQITELTYEMNGIAEKTKLREKMIDMVFGLVHK